MPSAPEPTTTFEVFGQAIYALDPFGTIPKGLIVIFAVSEASRKWLAWYQFNTTYAAQSVLMRAGHAVIGEGSAHSRHFKTDKPITVEEFCGPIAYDRGQKEIGGRLSHAHLRGGHGKTIDVDLEIKGVHGANNNLNHFWLHINGIYGDFSPWGNTEFLMSEPFAYPGPHLNVPERLRNVRRNALHP